MEPVNAKPVSASRTEHVQIVMPGHINGEKRLFGGILMEWIDVTAAVAARRHSGCNVTTAAVDNLQFQAPALRNDTVVLCAQVTHTGRTSMEVRVDTFVEALSGEKQRINRAYLVLVALDEKGDPTPVPPLLPETEEEHREWEAACRRRELRRQRRSQQF
ncbi:MAG: acyl-CoA thioesterase [Oscillospiraceae bacterium]|jgi:acyl-CoA hydrolase|nr:acyl-CoA thioesterase [Oscillospiraceae bacterium]